MEGVISQLEEILADIGFSGTAFAESDVIRKLDEAIRHCRELDMKLGGSLCGSLSESLKKGDSRKSAEMLCRLSCYVQCLKGFS